MQVRTVKYMKATGNSILRRIKRMKKNKKIDA